MVIVCAFEAVCMFVLVLFILMRFPPEVMIKNCEEFTGMLHKNGKSTQWYVRQEKWLAKNGAKYHYGRWVSPGSFLALRVVLGSVVYLAISKLSVGYGLICGPLAFMTPGWLLLYMNKQDNNKLLPEIKLVFHALEIQIRAGVYVTDALSECYRSVSNVRLRDALMGLSGDLTLRKDTMDALNRFQGKFDNRNIDVLCITIIQALESGKAVELLSDMAAQVRDMESSLLERRKASMDRSFTFYQLGILVAVMGVVLYGCITNMYAAVINF